ELEQLHEIHDGPTPVEVLVSLFRQIVQDTGHVNGGCCAWASRRPSLLLCRRTCRKFCELRYLGGYRLLLCWRAQDRRQDLTEDAHALISLVRPILHQLQCWRT